MKMNESVAKALSLFDRYAEMPQAALSKALSELQQKDADVCAGLMRLLAADEQTHSFASPLQWFAAQDGSADNDSAPGSQRADRIWPDGTRLGPWCVDGIIGLGGMGVIYAAHRADGLYERQVALKTIRAEIMSPSLQQAFAKERSHLAKLEHPSIVALYDAGVVENGQPWLAMARVHGDSIERWCDTHKKSLKDRVRLLIETCDAISFAHAHGVLHQDIKPSNLLVSEDGKVKLLDFGLSAMLTPHGDAGFIRIGMSSAYAAPEVFDGAPPSVAIDVYALGVVLYRLLCDGWPRTPRMVTALPNVRNDAAQSPSHLAITVSLDTAQARGVQDAQALSGALKGDLDAIALRCVSHDPVARYASVADLRADLQAWLARRPVAASDGGWVYRTSRFVRRNAVPVAMMSVLALSAAIGGGMMLKQQQSARLEAENSEILSRLFETSLGAATLSSLGSTPLSSQQLLEDVEQQLRRAAGERRPQFLARGLSVLSRSYLVRADYAKVERLIAESQALDSDNALQHARNNAVLAELFLARAETSEALKAARAGMQLLPPDSGPDTQRVRLDLQLQLAAARNGAGDSKAAVAILNDAVKAAESLGAAGIIPLAELLATRGSIQYGSVPIDVIERDFSRAFALIANGNRVVRNRISLEYVNVLLHSNRNEEAHRYAAEALIGNLDVFGPRHPETGRAWRTIGTSWYAIDELRRAKIALKQSADITRKSLGRLHPDLGIIMLFEGALAGETGDLSTALAKTREATAIYEHVYGHSHKKTMGRYANTADALKHSARYSLNDQRKSDYYREADVLLSMAIRESERIGANTSFLRDDHAAVQLYFARVQDAEKNAVAAVSEADRAYGPDSRMSINAKHALLQVRTAQGRCVEARRLYESLFPLLGIKDDKLTYDDFYALDLFLDMQIACGDAASARSTYAMLKRIAQRNGYMEIFRTIPAPDTSPSAWRPR